MPSTDAWSIHPDLVPRATAVRNAGIAMLVVGVGAAIGVAALYSGWERPIAALVCIAVFTLAAYHVAICKTRWYRRATWVLAEVAPVEGKVLLSRDDSGSIFAAFQALGTVGAGNSWVSARG